MRTALLILFIMLSIVLVAAELTGHGYMGRSVPRW